MGKWLPCEETDTCQRCGNVPEALYERDNEYRCLPCVAELVPDEVESVLRNPRPYVYLSELDDAEKWEG